MKNVYKDNTDVAKLVSSQERRAAVVPRVNRSLCSSIGLHRISLVRASGRRSEHVFSMLWRVRGMVVSWANRSVGVTSFAAPAPPPAVRRLDPSRPWYVKVLDSTRAAHSMSELRFDRFAFHLRYYSRTCLAWKVFTETNRCRYIGLQPGMKSDLRATLSRG